MTMDSAHCITAKIICNIEETTVILIDTFQKGAELRVALVSAWNSLFPAC